jgi:hypothetical protein
MTQSYYLGLTVPESNVDKCIEALHNINQISKFDRIKYEQGCKEYLKFISPEKFHVSIKQVLESL